MKKTLKRTFEKVDELTFKITETQDVSENIDAIAQLNNLAQALNKLRQLTATANKAQDEFVKRVDWYNEWRSILLEAKEKLHLAISIPDEIKLPSCFSIIEVDIEKLPKVDVWGQKVWNNEKADEK